MSSTDETDWAELGALAEQSEDLAPALLRGVLAGALDRLGYDTLVVDDKPPWVEPGESKLPGILAFSLLWSLGISGASAVGLPWYLWWLGLLATALAVFLLGKTFNNSAGVGISLLIAWIALGVVEVSNDELLLFAVAYGLPLLILFAYGISRRALPLRDAQDVALALGGVIKSAPLVIPLVLVVLFLPALSADLWNIGGRLDADSLLIVAVLSIGVLLVVVRLQLGGQVERMLDQRARLLCDRPDRAELTRAQAKPGSSGPVAMVEEMDGASLDATWPTAGHEYVPYLNSACGGVLQSPLTAYLLITVAAVGALLSLYIYLLCSAVVPSDLAAQWSHSSVPQTEIELVGTSITLSGGPFLKLAALLGLVATAVFLAFALIEERFATALTDALLRDPSDRFLVLALPYLNLRERILYETFAKGGPQSSSSEA
jgi:hypothetical protein